MTSFALISIASYAQRPRWSSHTYAVGGGADSFPQQVVIADVNGDGINDLVIPLPNVPEVAVLLGKGDGTFQSARLSPYDGSPQIAVADYTGDHKLDLATPERLYRGSGDGYFHYTSLLPEGGNYVLAGNFNKDGKADLVTLGYSDLWTLLGNGRGDFTAKSTAFAIKDGYAIGSWFSTDLNGDGISDLVIQQQRQDSPYPSGPPTWNEVEIGKADGTFTALTPIADQLSTPGFGSMGLGDVNGDKKLDLVVSGAGPSGVLQVHTYLGKGNGTFAPSVTANVNCYAGFAMGDLNGDGRSDLLCNAGSDQSGTITVTFYSSNGNGSYTQGTSIKGATSVDSSYAEGGIFIADLNKDGTRDAILLNTGFGSTGSSVTVLLNLSGTSMPVSTTPATLVYKQPFSISAPVTASVIQTLHPSGSVTYKDGTTSLRSASLGAATHISAGLSVGVHSLSADYAGDGNFNSHCATVTRTVGKASSSAKLTSSSISSTHGHAVTFTATASPEYAGVPSGKITFKNGSTILATVTVSSGKATYTTSSLAVGTHSITARYSGDGNFNGSTSPAVLQKVN
jgi:hypothetical protein